MQRFNLRRSAAVLLLLVAILLFCTQYAFAQSVDEPGFEFPEWYITLMGVLVPFVIQALKPVSWSRVARFCLSVLLVAVSGFLGCLFTGKVNTGDIVQTIIWIFAASQATYNLWWKALFEYWGFGKS